MKQNRVSESDGVTEPSCLDEGHKCHLWPLDVEYLIGLRKYAVDKNVRRISDVGFNVDLYSDDSREDFILDFHRSHMVLKYTCQCRCRKEIPLLRVDVGYKYHRNPIRPKKLDSDDPMYDLIEQYAGEEITGPHIHIYREGYWDTWAFPLDEDFTDAEDVLKTYEQFMRKCNVVTPPTIRWGPE